MSGSSTLRSCKDRGTEASAFGRPEVTSSQGGVLGAIVFSQVDNLDHPGKVELVPNSYGQLLTLYLLFRRNGLPQPSDNVIKHCFALKQYPLPRGSYEDSLHDGMYCLVVRADEHKGLLQGNPSSNAGGMSALSIVAGSAAYPSSTRDLSAVAQEYLKRATMLYEEFLTRGLSQCIEEDEGPYLRHTLVRHALLRPSLGSRSGSLARRGPSIGCALAALVILRAYGLVERTILARELYDSKNASFIDRDKLYKRILAFLLSHNVRTSLAF
ncbi:hypothetical protein ACOSQ2_021384 [Xanthoceras sorbifolium]